MGLQTWKNAPKGRILKSDTKIAKNYLSLPKCLPFLSLSSSIAKPLIMYSFKICVAQILNWVALLELTR
jgi:hypothetical protein